MKKILNIIILIISISSQVFAQWQLLNSPILPVNDMLKLSNGTILIGTGNGLFLSDDNFLSWDSTSLTNNINLIRKDNFGNIYASALESVFNPPGYLFRSTDLGITWTIPYDLVPDYPFNVQNIFINDSGYIYTIQDHGSDLGIYTPVLKSTDFGTNWSLIYYSFCACDQTGLGFSFIENVYGSQFLSDIFLLHPQLWMIYSIRRKEPGGNWATIANKFAYNMYLYNDELYMATTSVYDSSLGLIKSSDDGNTFVQLNNGFSDLDVQQLILQPEVFIALNDDGIYRSLDQGNNWVKLDHTGLNGSINKVYYDNNYKLYACTSNGIYVFTGELPVELIAFNACSNKGIVTLNWTTAAEINNHGFEIERSNDKASWRLIGFKEGNGTTTETHNYSFTDNLLGVSSSTLYYRLKQIDYDGSFEYSDIVEVDIAPSTYSLSQNYPNPFNPNTTINYSIPNAGVISLKVYDVLGKEVATLVNEEKPAGKYEVEVDGYKLPSGIYFYQLKAGSFVETKKMILMK